ncbi:DHH family phosphoesterase [Haladaptatus caseinilyticus]|uniref:DHH family phosphoesterase n=1 Tax=Haladaptatus caseinilyticus TaxID=2993314 RepID=UPI00224B62CA|nr:bifunctional oligoribonuclease/PAP phosphatase NrnA [Haladaptatus caseinilyticus]
MTRVQQVVDHLQNQESLLIVCHNNPDPDCLASALALKRIGEYSGVETVTIAYNGGISHQQNRALVNRLDVPLVNFDDELLENHDSVAFVDHSVPGENNDVPSTAGINIVLDHHPATHVTADVIDRRENVGSTATILVEYLHDLQIVPESALATALLIGIRSDTLGFTRKVSAQEYAAAEYLHPFIDQGLFANLLNVPYTSETIDALSEAIENRKIQQSSLVSFAGVTTERDALPQAADFLLNLQGINITVIFGVINDEVQFSARSADPATHVGELLDQTFGSMGSLGGHQQMAGGCVPLLKGDKDHRQIVEIAISIITNRLFHELTEFD